MTSPTEKGRDFFRFNAFRYEGLLARTAEEQKKRKSKKAEVDENQLSIFDFAA